MVASNRFLLLCSFFLNWRLWKRCSLFWVCCCSIFQIIRKHFEESIGILFKHSILKKNYMSGFDKLVKVEGFFTHERLDIVCNLLQRWSENRIGGLKLTCFTETPRVEESWPFWIFLYHLIPSLACKYSCLWAVLRQTPPVTGAMSASCICWLISFPFRLWVIW